jgi:hypothetical protein
LNRPLKELQKKEVLDPTAVAAGERKSDSSITRRSVDGRVKPGHDNDDDDSEPP